MLNFTIFEDQEVPQIEPQTSPVEGSLVPKAEFFFILLLGHLELPEFGGALL